MSAIGRPIFDVPPHQGVADAIARFVGQGLAGFIQKPLNVDDLKECLSALF